MKAIIIAAGKGSRIPEISKYIPKSLIKINGKSLLERQIDFIRKLDIDKISIVKGYKSKKINYKKIKYFVNKNFAKSEQLDSLFCAKKWFDDDLIIVFSDIIYDFSLLKKIVNSKKEFAIAIQKNWKKKYKKRFDHPMDQADKVLIKKKKVSDIGKGLSINATNGEFLGIFKLSKKISLKLRNEYRLLRKSRKTHKFQIHDFFKYLIKKSINIEPVYVNGKYMEIDTGNDLKIAKKIFYEK